MITSKRKFGVEIEFIAPTSDSLYNVSSKVHVVSDGSLRPNRHAGEYVSSILEGKSGEAHIREVCELLKKNQVDVENPVTSMHIHLDGGKKENKLVSSKRKMESNSSLQIAISNRVSRSLSKQYIIDMIKGNSIRHIEGTETTVFEGILYFSRASLTREPRMNYTYYQMETLDRFEWIKRVFYFYVQYSEQISSLVSKSRKDGNMYCIPIGKSYDLDEIEAMENMEDLSRVWYKTDPTSGRYNNSRYHDFNLHCFFRKTGTVELRSHGGTIDPDKVLLWVKLHQHILDKLEDMTLDEIKSDGAKFKTFLEFIDQDMLEEYVRRLWGYFSNVRVKK